MEQGWVYVLVNSSIPNMAKVGRTTHAPAQRAAELSAATGVATPFVLAFDQPFENCVEAERRVHGELDRRGLRVAPNREFFRGAPSEIIKVVIEVAEQIGPAAPTGPNPCAERLRLAAEGALFGEGDILQDTGEALRLYKLASARGSLLAFERMGQIYTALYLAKPDRPRRRRSMMALKEGARRGNYYCYCEMAVIFAADHHIANFVKAWNLFFTQRISSFVQELELDPGRHGAACGRYIGQALELGLKPAHFTELSGAADTIIANLLADLQAVRTDQAARQPLTTALRWAYENLQAPPVPIATFQPANRSMSPNWVRRQAIVSVS
jgi:hypothetical protein